MPGNRLPRSINRSWTPSGGRRTPSSARGRRQEWGCDMAACTPIDTPRLVIEPFAERHLTPKYAGWLNDPEVTRYSDQRFAVHTLESCRRYAESFDGTPNYFWAIVAKDPSLGHLGNINAYTDPLHGV